MKLKLFKIYIIKVNYKNKQLIKFLMSDKRKKKCLNFFRIFGKFHAGILNRMTPVLLTDTDAFMKSNAIIKSTCIMFVYMYTPSHHTNINIYIKHTLHYI